MAPEISRREVLDNLIRFKDSVVENHGKEHPKSKRIYKVLLNRKTGDMRFPQKIGALELHIARKKTELPGDWKAVQIVVFQEREIPHFEVQDTHNRTLESTEMDPLAWKVIRETLEVLNEMAKTLQKSHAAELLEETVLSALPSIHLLVPIENLPGWLGKMSREGAERELKKQKVGTYLFREAEILTLATTSCLAKENGFSVHPFLLTVVEREEKMTEFLFLKTIRGWTLYRDNPNLDLYSYFSSPQALLTEVSIAKHPVSRGGF